MGRAWEILKTKPYSPAKVKISPMYLCFFLVVILTDINRLLCNMYASCLIVFLDNQNGAYKEVTLFKL